MESPAKKNQTPLIIAAVAIVLCCCLIALAVAGYFGYRRMQSSQIIPPVSTEEPVLVNPTDAVSSPGEAPTGGLGNDILRNNTWQAVAGAAQGMGCGTVACASGESYPFEITFTLDATGATYDIKSLP